MTRISASNSELVPRSPPASCLSYQIPCHIIRVWLLCEALWTKGLEDMGSGCHESPALGHTGRSELHSDNGSPLCPLPFHGRPDDVVVQGRP